MKIFRLVLWVIIVAMALALGWLTYEWQRTENQLAGGPYGTPFELVDQTGKPITEAAFRGRPTALFFGYPLPGNLPNNLVRAGRLAQAG